MRKHATLIISLLIICLLFNSSSIKAQDTMIYDYEELMSTYMYISNDMKGVEIDQQLLLLERNEALDKFDDKERDMNDYKEDYEDSLKKDDEDETEDNRDLYYDAAKTYAESKSDLIIKEYEANHNEQLTKDKKEILSYQFEQQLWQYYYLSRQLELLQLTTEFYLEQYEISQTSYERNLITEQELTESKLAYEQKKLQANQLELNIQMMEKNLRVTLGINIDEAVTFDLTEPSPLEPIDISYETINKSFKTKSIEYNKQDVITTSNEEYYKILSEIYPEDSNEFKDLTYKDDKAEMDAYNYTQNIDKMLINEYYTYTMAVDTYNFMIDSLKVAENQYAEVKAAYETGQISQIEFNGAALQLETAKLEYEKAIIDYNLALEKVSLLMQGIIVQ